MPHQPGRDERKLALAIRSQVIAGRDLIRVDEGLVVDREHAQAIAAGLELAAQLGATWESISRNSTTGEWSAHLIHQLGRFTR